MRPSLAIQRLIRIRLRAAAGRFTALDEREIYRSVRAALVDLFCPMGRTVEPNRIARAPRRP
jgi:hypothetical protein